jgi:succinoglycan biosynthesis protein ExoM
MNKVAICIPTYKRPYMLKKLLISIFNCNIDTALVKDVDLIIVDNDVDRTAELIVTELKNKLPATFTLSYYNYPAKGLSNVRNELIRLALLTDPDYIDFIDDDEYVTADWLNELVNTIIICNADAVRGPVIADAEDNVPEYIWYWFSRENYPDKSQIFSFTTGNLLLKRSSFQKYDVWFDKRFNTTGAEDVYFGNQLLKRGATIYWSANAITYETIPRNRTSIYWIMKRKFRGATNFVYSLKLEKQYVKLLIKVMVSIVYIIIGTLALLMLLLPIKRRLWGLIKIWEGIGGISGLLNFRSIGY